ncbi:MAG: ATP-binding protein, partial [Gammaproteobacteria bacterium]|jgi:signal transduction histidine kinase
LPVLCVDSAANIVFANDVFAEALGFESAEALIGTNLLRARLTEEAAWAAWENQDLQTFRFRHAGGDPVLLSGSRGKGVDDAGNPIYHCIFFRQGDSQETGQLLEHAARMEAVAGLSSGIAHDFNNLLTVLVGNLYLLGEELRDNETAFARIKAARDTALRGAELTRQLLNYARGEDSDAPEVNPASAVWKLQPLLEKLVGSRIALHVDVTAEERTVTASRAQLESAIVNLVINARDAIEGDGIIRVGVHEAAGNSALETQLSISVTDNGPGMTAQVRRRVFEPFFTTKGEGRGTGLGLSMVRWFAQSAAGDVEIDSAPGSGTTVTILLPQSGNEIGDTTCSRTIPLSVLPSGDERIALLIDDAEVRAMTQQTLTVLGYDVDRVSRDDIVNADSNAATWDLAVVDADNCENLVALVADLRSNSSMRVLALTARKLPELGQDIQLRKPFSLVELAGGVRGVLDGESVSG